MSVSIETILLGIILITVTVLIPALPLISRKQERGHDDLLIDKQTERLNVYYDRVLRNLRDLEEDHALGKISDEDYAAEREIWMQRGVQALKALDTLAKHHPVAMTEADNASVDRAIEDAIEAAVAKARSP